MPCQEMESGEDSRQRAFAVAQDLVESKRREGALGESEKEPHLLARENLVMAEIGRVIR